MPTKTMRVTTVKRIYYKPEVIDFLKLLSEELDVGMLWIVLFGLGLAPLMRSPCTTSEHKAQDDKACY